MSHKEAQKDWRVFCAVELPAEVRARLEEHILRLRKEVPDAVVSWSRVENIHLTLKFFGNVAVKRIEKISEVADRVGRQFSRFQIRVGDTGVFPRPSRAQVLWIGVSDPSGQLSALHKNFEDECGAVGFEKEDRAYRPHLTIARLRKPEGAQRLAEAHLQMKFETIEVELKELVVFRSELSPKGSRYTPISRVSF
ncbi:MAG TPA: RNA 2',3'-cyclic phosphodiesterase [Pyrinomonadaceae bacterium]|nr:RNA 2',3'-cyclic phosphodiesterase [Pyrinomonadaceae bacterium]